MFKLKEYILEIEKTGSFSQAAANLYVSQPSLSASVKRLEEKIGEPLFDRSAYPVRPTECGKEYCKAARMIQLAEGNFQDYLEEYSACKTGELVIGGSNLNLSFVLPTIIKDFHRIFPGIHMEIVEGNIDSLCKQLGEGKLDFVVDSCEMDTEQFTEYVYRAEHLLLAMPVSFACNEGLEAYRMSREDICGDLHLSDQVPVLPLKKLQDTPFLFLMPETDTYKRAMKICQKAGFEPHVALSFHQHSTVFHMACAGMGAAFISDTLVRNVHADPNLCYYKVDGNEGFRNIRFYKKKEKRMTRAMKAFLETAGVSA